MAYKALYSEVPEELWLPGNSSCQGCGSTLSIRWVLKALGKKTVMVVPASCANVYVGWWPKSSAGVTYLDMAFAAGGSVASGIVAALEYLGRKNVNVVTWAGDGGTTDIGIQALSGAAERGTNFIYICYDNEAYMNTGTQRSSSTPMGAWTTTTPFGKKQQKKNVPMIMAAHNIPYVATACPSYSKDLYEKMKKAKGIEGTKYVHILAPCPPGWRFDTELTVEIGKLAVETGMWVLYEVENGVFRLSSPSKRLMDSSKRKPIEEYIRLQGRFKDIKGEEIRELQRWVDEQWERYTKFEEGCPVY
ncbi:MAG: 3-methyl-2-oxobutanoate dehydrogenase subunit beta [Candidatus Jordarchaeum sp.]|uniref:3-methyl-2-oxobutanoate dehydrogenase subunit beta n=1 Tax=Candidatus Jordarchaeum sp. TaxID=2823881 RepID=UPI00404B44A3